jgi:hypothetical protein
MLKIKLLNTKPTQAMLNNLPAELFCNEGGRSSGQLEPLVSWRL